MSLEKEILEFTNWLYTNNWKLIGDLIKEWVNANVASIECGLGYKAINQCARGKTKTSGGFVWKYKD